MSKSQKFQITPDKSPITCHAWNADRTKVAISPNNTEVHIYALQAGKFVIQDVLKEHTSRVTSVDWHRNDTIVTSGEDRNAYVWQRTAPDGVWKPELVLLRMNRAATCAKWSDDGKKFACGSGARLVGVCYFEEENDWWVTPKHLKKPIRSTVTCVDWHNNGTLLAVGSSDFKARIFACGIKNAGDKKPPETCWAPAKTKFGTCVAEFSVPGNNGGWVHSVSFSASGDKLAFVGHDSTVCAVDGSVQGDDRRTVVLKTKGLPYRALTWVSETQFVCAGHGYVPDLYSFEGGEIRFVRCLDAQEKKAVKTMSALDKFRRLDSLGTASADKTGTERNSTHQNSISGLSIHTGDKSDAKIITSTGMDGLLVNWTL